MAKLWKKQEEDDEEEEDEEQDPDKDIDESASWHTLLSLAANLFLYNCPSFLYIFAIKQWKKYNALFLVYSGNTLLQTKYLVVPNWSLKKKNRSLAMVSTFPSRKG